ncbi:hypothetical protein N7462_010897 [Penicillium macrosclerotiorum]|uniref:uncharacterized protein n=1 Tax=Penicillium macrosclerotiorum TaxID=303699 RepID=UPI0025487635|nr:uncharacterized protein N7462_010897 [Penicillium macrosclerotiorum]KAJ5669827.1 hypothetical protein N7462_010897 [Penicillium macrosclerotiorum]
MAAVFVPPSPQPSLNMSTRRPLANVPNATNSPHRAGLVPAKRARSGQIEIPHGQPPPKKQVMEAVEQGTRSPSRSRSTTYQGTESKLFARRPNNNNPSAFEKKLVAAREKERNPHLKGTKTEKPSADTLDTIRQWQRHYRKAFPQFVFYFDSIPEDVRRKFSRQVVALGAREEKFFSRLVTHVVTSRPIPPETATTSPTEESTPAADGANGETNMQTVNPSLLEKNADFHVSLKNDARRDQGTMDILQRARQMGMKIWALEKLQRMITTINDNDIGGQGDSASRSKVGGGSTAHGRGDNDLSRVLRHELLNGPSDRDPFSSLEIVMFKGPFIYIHDMNEKTKPVMVREYPRVARRQDGTWPQFRSAPLGKCPFIDEPPSRKEYDRHRMRQTQKEKKMAMTKVDEPSGKQPTASTTEETIDTQLVTDLSKPKKLSEDLILGKQPEVLKKPLLEENHERKSSESFIPLHFPRTGPFYTGREPAASGVQPSNVTSAIRSQMISSTAAGPGAKAGLSKELYGLQRKVLEKGTGTIVTGTMGAPQRPSTGSGSHHTHSAKSIAIEKDAPPQDVAGTKRRRDEQVDSQQKKPERRRDPKPGYCENCRDKFDDFEEHTMTRKHRRFAQNTSNWAELDALLFEIQRPLKEEYEFDE